MLPTRRGDSALEAAAGAFADYLRRRHPGLASRVVAFDDEAALEDYVTAAEVRQPSTFKMNRTILSGGVLRNYVKTAEPLRERVPRTVDLPLEYGDPAARPNLGGAVVFYGAAPDWECDDDND